MRPVKQLIAGISFMLGLLLIASPVMAGELQQQLTTESVIETIMKLSLIHI